MGVSSIAGLPEGTGNLPVDVRMSLGGVELRDESRPANIYLDRTTRDKFELYDDVSTWGTYTIHPGQMRQFIDYDMLLRQHKTPDYQPLGYAEFIAIYNSDPDSKTQFAEFDKLTMDVHAYGAAVNRLEFKVGDRDFGAAPTSLQLAPGERVVGAQEDASLRYSMIRNIQTLERDEAFKTKKINQRVEERAAKDAMKVSLKRKARKEARKEARLARAANDELFGPDVVEDAIAHADAMVDDADGIADDAQDMDAEGEADEEAAVPVE